MSNARTTRTRIARAARGAAGLGELRIVQVARAPFDIDAVLTRQSRAMEMLPLLIPVVVATIIGARIFMRSSTTQPWSDAAHALGLGYSAATFSKGPRIWGHVDGYSVEVDIVQRGSGNTKSDHTRHIVRGGGRIPTDVALASETFWSSLDIMGKEIEVGHSSFDEIVRVRGVESTVLALLDANARRCVADFIRTHKGMIKDGDVSCEVSGRERNGPLLEARLRAMLEIAVALTLRHDEVTARMADNVRDDPAAGVRLRNLEYLCRHYRLSKECKTACERALHDKSPRIRLLAAKSIGARGVGVLEAILDDQGAPRDVVLSAYALLVDRLPRQDLERRTHAILRGSHDPLVVEALVVVADQRIVAARERTLALVSQRHPTVVAAAARALGVIGEGLDSPTIAALLDHEEDTVKIAACEALAKIGRVDAVEPLLEHTKGMFKNGDLKRVARGAVEAIQSRAGDVGGGRLSVVEQQGLGALSVAKNEPGALSVAKGEAGSTSIVDDD